MSHTTWIKDAKWLIAWDEERMDHKYVRDGDLVFKDDKITFVGSGYKGQADTIIDGKDFLVMPGLGSLHSHPQEEAIGKSFYEDMASGDRWLTKDPNYYSPLATDEEAFIAGTQVGICQLLKSGCTTYADLTIPNSNLLMGLFETVASSGIRAYLAPMISSAGVYSSDGKSFEHAWDEAKGEEELEITLDFIDRVQDHPSGLIHGMICPEQANNVTAELFRKCYAAAEERGIPLQTHASQMVAEVDEMLRRHGKSPIEWLHDIGVLGPNMILGHVLYTDFHPRTKDKVHRDIEILVETGTTVAHCPRVFAPGGEAMHSFGAYRQAGVKLVMGTDTYPLNIIEEMQLALVVSRIASESSDYPKSQHVFEAATTGVAKALNRTDICRFSVGAQADVVLVDLMHHSMRPARDPLKNLLHTASSEVVRDVYVAGQLVVSDREVLTIDFDDALKRLGEGQQRAMKRVPEIHHAGKTAEEISPFSLPVDDSTRVY